MFKVNLVTAPSVEPISLSELEEHLGISAGTVASDVTNNACILPASYPIDYELLTLDVAPGGLGWAAGDTLTGQTSTKTCVIVTVLTTLTYIVKSRSGAFTLGEIISNGTATADQGATKPTFTTTYNNGYMILGTPVDVLGHKTIVYLQPTANGASGTIDAKIQECDTLTGTYTDWAGGGFTQVTTANDDVIQEIEYTGSKRYIRTVGKVLVAACSFGSNVMVWEPNTSDEDVLTELIKTSRLNVEFDTGRKLVTQTWDYFIQGWPSEDRIKIPFGNLQSVTYIKWKDTDGTETTLTATTDYLVELNGDQCGFIVLPYGGTWPSGTLYPSKPISIRFVCGYGVAADVPVQFKQAIKRKCTNLYMNKGDDTKGQGYNYTEDKTYDRLVTVCSRLFDMDFL